MILGKLTTVFNSDTTGLEKGEKKARQIFGNQIRSSIAADRVREALACNITKSVLTQQKKVVKSHISQQNKTKQLFGNEAVFFGRMWSKKFNYADKFGAKIVKSVRTQQAKIKNILTKDKSLFGKVPTKLGYTDRYSKEIAPFSAYQQKKVKTTLSYQDKFSKIAPFAGKQDNVIKSLLSQQSKVKSILLKGQSFFGKVAQAKLSTAQRYDKQIVHSVISRQKRISKLYSKDFVSLKTIWAQKLNSAQKYGKQITQSVLSQSNKRKSIVKAEMTNYMAQVTRAGKRGIGAPGRGAKAIRDYAFEPMKYRTTGDENLVKVDYLTKQGKIAKETINLATIATADLSKVAVTSIRDQKRLYDEMASRTNRAQRAIKGLSTAFRRMKTVIRKIKVVWGAFAALVSSFGLKGIALQFLKTADEVERLKISLDVIVKGKGEQTFKALNQWAAKMPINTMKAAHAFRKMSAMGLRPSIQDMTTLIDTYVAMGSRTQVLDRIVLAMGQIATKPKLAMQEMRQLGEQGIPVMEILKEKLHITGQEFDNLAESGLTAKQVMGAIMEGLEERFGGLARKSMDTWTGMVEQFIQKWFDFKRAVMNAGIYQVIKDRAQDLINFLETNQGRLMLKDAAEGVARSALLIGGTIMKVAEWVAKLGNIMDGVIKTAMWLFNYSVAGVIAVISEIDKSLLSLEQRYNKIADKVKDILKKPLEFVKSDRTAIDYAERVQQTERWNTILTTIMKNTKEIEAALGKVQLNPDLPKNLSMISALLFKMRKNVNISVQKLFTTEGDPLGKGMVESLKNASKFADETKSALSKLADEAANAYDQMQGAGASWANTLEDQILEVTNGGKMAFRDMARSILNDLQRIIIRTQITANIAQAMNAGISNAASWFNTIGQAAILPGITEMMVGADATSASSMLNVSQNQRPTSFDNTMFSVDSSGFIGLNKSMPSFERGTPTMPDLSRLGRASGGRVEAHQPYIVGERRPELFVPDAAGRIEPRVENKGDAVNVVLNISTGVADTVKAEIAQLLPTISEVVKGAVAQDITSNGMIAAAIGR